MSESRSSTSANTRRADASASWNDAGSPANEARASQRIEKRKSESADFRRSVAREETHEAAQQRRLEAFDIELLFRRHLNVGEMQLQALIEIAVLRQRHALRARGSLRGG